MNLFSDYQKEIFKSIKNLEKKGLIIVPINITNFTVELPPKNQNADMSCNAAMVLAKSNKASPNNLAEILKKHLLSSFKEFKTIDIAGPGFLNFKLRIKLFVGSLISIIRFSTFFIGCHVL